jgi:hypothetical protein
MTALSENSAREDASAPREDRVEARAVGSGLSLRDRLRHWGYRWGRGRLRAAVPPGLYRVGRADPQSPVLVSANYRFSFDLLRSALAGRNAWILVLDTHGINVWCAAGKGTFGTGELVRLIGQQRLGEVVAHRRLVVPQLGAVGVSAHEVKKATGFTVRYGPVHVRDLPAYLDSGKATPAMRRVTFRLAERLAVAPMELVQAFLPLAGIAAAIALAAGWRAGTAFFLAGISATLAVPAFHDWLPGSWLSVKGLAWGLIASGAAAWGFSFSGLPLAALLLSITSVSAYLALNFTGATTYTPVNGVKREMRRMLPFMLAGAALGAAGWITIAAGRIFS